MRQIISIWTISLSLTTFSFFGQENNIGKQTQDKFSSRDLTKIQTLQDLAKNINELTSDKKEQLQMLLLWSHQNMYADSIRFFQNGYPLTTKESFKKRIALCDEFSNILTEFCEIMKIPSIRIVGYVKYLNYKSEDIFTDCNHAWNAVYVDSSWMLCDMFWATNTLKVNRSSIAHFVKSLNTKYYLAHPKTFVSSHLPADPVFQFDNNPIKINSFTAYSDSINLKMDRLPYLNYNDSIKLLMKLNNNDRSLRIAQHSYMYNKNNPNFLIAEYYNYGVLIVNNKNSTKVQLKRAKNYFNTAIELIDKSDKEDIKMLKDNCTQGIVNINKRINTP